ncbi:MAG: adenosylmethionine decarboxylase [Halobacteriovoraceae bacterium]|nr:adenosylmethionine decarboxylase [Halobacteriovoraceae bacterium]
MFFEGSEKKAEVVVSKVVGSLLDFERQFWVELVARAQAEIISEIHNPYCRAYLLSESSLFVWKDRILLITCGETTLVNSILFLAKKIGPQNFESLIFQRKNEYHSHLQRTNIFGDVQQLREQFKGTLLRVGNLDGHFNYLFHLDKKFNSPLNDVTTELLMYHINGPAAKTLRTPYLSKDQIRMYLQIDDLFPDFQIDDFAFSPLGYSLNGIKDDKYITIHITPEEEVSYVSFETNIDIKGQDKDLLNKILNVYGPETYDLLQFDTKNDVTYDGVCINHVEDHLSCGYKIEFKHFHQVATKPDTSKIV